MEEQKLQVQSMKKEFGRRAHASGRSVSKFGIIIWGVAVLAGAGYLIYAYTTNASPIIIKVTWLFVAICAIRMFIQLFELNVFWGKEKNVKGEVVEEKK